MGRPVVARCRDPDIEDRSLGVVRLDPDPPADPPDELAGDVEAEPRAADAAGHVGVEAVEIFGDPVALRGGGGHAGGGNHEKHPALRAPAATVGDAASPR